MTMKHRVTHPGLLLCLAFGGAACERTAEGIRQDTLAATAAASDSAEQAKQKLEGQLSEFKTETNEKLAELSDSVSKLQSKTNENIDESKAKLQAEIDATKAKLEGLSSKS